MAKLFVPQSSCIFAVIIFVLLVLSVGLLVFVLKGQLHHENSLSLSDGVSHVRDTSPPRATTHIPSPHTAPKTVTTRSPDPADVPIPTLSDDTPWLDFRLPKYIVPLHYDLLLHPDLDTDTFSGTVNVTVNVTRATRHFVVHAYRLAIKDSKVQDLRQDSAVNVEKHFAYNPHEYFVVATERAVEPGQYRLSFAFSGILNGTIVGFYKSRYKNSRNETRYLATSKFQPTYARRAFPCFDEPSFKSTFSVALVHKKEFTALSNMPVEVTELYSDPNLFVTKFQKSVPMVTYLACFIVCDFEYQGTTISSGKPFRVYTTPDQVNLTSYAMKFGSRVLEYFEKYFEIDYPLPKQDMVAIPDFSSGAMEHWGVITFRETNLLYDPDNSSPGNLQRISAVISHEMVHMWFGNLVTMGWWEDLWLNEGFASYVEYKGVDEQHPDWDTLSQFVTEELQPVLNLDSAMNSHPIVQPVVHPDEITEIFDDISYGKGASILRMLEFFVGKDSFRTGISNFLKKYQYKNAKTMDLWEELSEACGYQGNRSIAQIMKTWTEQMGFPYINVVRRDQDASSHFVAKQTRFLKNRENYLKQNNTKEYVWSVPLSYNTESNKSGIVWLHDTSELEFSVPVKQDEWVKFNTNETGYYLVNYEKEEWQKFINLLTVNHEVLTPSDRSNLLFDSFLLAEEGLIDFDVFFSMSMYLKNETHLIPWETAYARFVYLCQLLESTEVNILLKSYMKDLTSALYKKLGWTTSDNHLDNLLRATIIGLACHSGNEDCLTHASELFQNWTQGQKVHSNLRSLVYNFGMAEIGREEHWNYMWNRYLVEDSPAQKKAIMNGLAHVRKPYLIIRYLDYAMDDENVRSQDFFTILTYIAGNPVGRPLVWNFIREKWPSLVERFTLNNRYLGNAVKKICSYFTTESELKEMKEFFAKYPDAGAGKRKRQQALEVVQSNIKWISTKAPHVKAWLEVEGSAPWFYHRLPPHILPEHYDLTLYPMLDKDMFNGSVAITVSLQKPSDCFLVHAKELNISKVEVFSENGLVELEDVFRYEEFDYLVLKAKKKLPVGSYRLYFEFDGPLTLSLKGLYKSSYLDPESKQRRYLATTQFAAVDARRAFPCFDEPVFRSTFNVSIIHNSSHFALSNAVVENVTELEKDLLITRFEKTFPMVTYILCIVVSDFDYKETITEKGVKLRVYSAPHLVNKTNYALGVASKILTYYEDYYRIPFPLKKLDMIAIPDIAFNGMENWGLITFIEKSLINDNTSTAAKYETCRLIAHELAHMWFGDLVTMKWWDDIWLNEGFATYLAPKGMRYVEPDIDVENDEVSRKLIKALRSDRTINSHPIVRRIVDVNSGIYDAIAYSKAASILRMLENYMGEDFREGISAYLKKYSFSNARTEDLWPELTAASKKNLNISAVMDTWTRQMNYPFVVIEKDGNTSDRYTMQQHRFLENPDSKMYSIEYTPYNYIWQIPMTFFTSEDPEVMHIMLNTSDKVSLSLPKVDWIKFNADFTGYYSVNYDLDGWKKLVQQMETNHTVFRPSDRINLLYDAYSLSAAGHLDYAVPLNLTRYLKNELYHGAWDLVLGELLRIKRYFKTDRETRELIKEFIRSLSKDLLKNVTWDDTGSYSERELKKLLIEAACESGNQDCLETAALLFKQWMKGTTQLSPDLSKMIYVYGLKVFNSEESWEFMWNKFLETSDPNEKLDLLYALATVRNTTLLERLMRFSKNETLIRKHDYFDILGKISQNSKGFPLITHLIFNKWNSLVKTYGTRETAEFAANVFKGYSTEKDLERVRAFYRRLKKTKEGAKAHLRALENIARNANWIKKHQSSVRTWMKKNVYMPWRGIRLPRHIHPTKYDITLHPNISKSTFEGSEEIILNITEKTSYILIHQTELRITRIELKSVDGNGSVAIAEEFPYKRNEFYVIILEEEIPSGMYVLSMAFSGKFSEDGRGIHRYEYTDRISGETKYVLATRFEATYARKLFPCFDEPAMKSKFKLSIIHHVNQTAVVSNMPEQETLPMPNDLVKTVFMESVQMSTYLLFCLVSDFKYLHTEYKGKQVRVYAPADRLHEAEHGLNLTVQLLEKLEEYFDVPYVLPKLDSVAIPNYTSSAMEHWGAIAYRTDRFLVNETLTEYKRIVDIERIIAHEIVHQWFGNLVTMNWWNDLWLNEGAATLIMYIPLRQIYPSINEVNVRKMSRMMCADSGMNSHPVVHNVTTPDEIEQVFDVISYEKGGAVMKMLQHVLKEDFRKGLSNYLKKYAYRNAETKDLWAELSNVSTMKVNISEMMDTWTRQMGFPYIELKRYGSTLTATQRWFSRTMNDSLAAKIAMEPRFSIYGFTWKIPLTYKNFATGNEYTLWLNERTSTFEINAMPEDVIKFNPGFVGFYIIKYDSHDWARLGQKLQENHEAFSTTDRYNLLHDAFMLAETDRLIYDIPLELTKYLKKEKEALPWNLFRDHFLHFMRRLDGESEAVYLLREYVALLTSELYDEYVNTSHSKSIFKKQSTSTGSCSYTYIDLQFIPTIVDLACRAGNKKCLNAVEEELHLWINKQNITSDLHFVLDIAISNFGNDTLWLYFYEELISNTTDKDRKYQMAEALISFSDPIQIRKTIETVAFDPMIDLELAKFMFQGLSSKDKAIPYLWNYTRNHWDYLMNRLDARNNPSIGISIFCDKLKTPEYIPEFQNLMITTEISEFIVEGCFEEIQNAVMWTEKYEETLTTWLTWNLSDRESTTHVN